MKAVDITDARKRSAGKVIVWYPFQLGGQIADRGMWCAEKNGEVIDYGKQRHLIADALQEKENVVVFTLHKNGSVSVREASN
jgi:hypothetical protein